MCCCCLGRGGGGRGEKLWMPVKEVKKRGECVHRNKFDWYRQFGTKIIGMSFLEGDKKC